VLPHHLHHKKEDDNSTIHPSYQSCPLTPPRLSESTRPSEVAEEQILKVIDRMEDEWDEHTYEDIVNLEIKLALKMSYLMVSLGVDVHWIHVIHCLRPSTDLCLPGHLRHLPWVTGFRISLSLVAAWATFRWCDDVERSGFDPPTVPRLLSRTGTTNEE
jgi:hypothetical protein